MKLLDVKKHYAHFDKHIIYVIFTLRNFQLDLKPANPVARAA